MEPKQSKMAQAIMAQMRKDLEKSLLTPAMYAYIEDAMLQKESRAVIKRFLFSTAAVITAVTTILGGALTVFNFWGGSK